MLIPLFLSGENGYGMAEAPLPWNTDNPLGPSAGFYHRTQNMDCTQGGAVPAWKSAPVGEGRLYYDPAYCFPWEDATAAPLVVWAGGITPYRYQDGTATAETAFANPCTGGVIWDDGAGNSVLLVGFGDALAAKTRTRAGTWAAFTQDVKFGKIAQVGSDLYAQGDAGAYSSWKFMKCPAGNKPQEVTGWGAGIAVGSPTWPINQIVDCNGAALVCEADGVFRYDETESRCISIMPWLAQCPHPDNGKGAISAPGGAIVPLHDGSLWFTDGYNATRIDQEVRPNIDTASACGRKTWLLDAGDRIYAACDLYQATGTPTKVFTYDATGAGTWDDITALVIDNKFSTTEPIGGLGDQANDAIFVGSTKPIVGIKVTMGVVNAALNTWIPYYWNGAAWVELTSAPVDTTTTANGYGFAQNGVITDYTAIHNLAVSATLEATGHAGSGDATARYWLKFLRGGTAAMTAGATLAEVEVIYTRPRLDTPASTDYTHFDLQNTYSSHILVGKRTAERIVWHDSYFVPTKSHITGGCLTTTRVGASANRGSTLFMVSSYYASYVAMGVGQHPRMQTSPALVTSTYGGALLYPCRLPFPQRVKANYFLIDVRHMSASDTVAMYMRWDQNPFFEVGRSSAGPIKIDVRTRNSGIVLETAVSYVDAASTEMFAPEIRGIWVDVDLSGEGFDAVVNAPEEIPSVE